MKKTTYCFKAAALAILLLCSYLSYSQTVTKQLYLTEPSQGLDRIDPVATADATLATAIIDPFSTTDVPGAAIWSGTNTPELRNWDGTSFGSNSNTGVSNGDRWRIMQGAACPTRDEKIVVGIESGGAVSGQLWDGSNWNAISIGGSTNFGSPGATYFWGLETAYESQSGDAMVVYGDGTNLRYSIWNGTTWSSETNITTCTTGTPYQMRLAAHPNTDEMVLVVNFTNETECALVWNGSSWGNSVTLDTSTTQVRTDIFVAYEQQSGNAMVVYEADTDVNAKYRIWNGSAWSAEATITAPSGPSGYARWAHLASQPGSNQIALGVLTTNSDVYFAIWDGSSWGNTVSATTSANGNIEPNVSVAIESLTGHVLGTYGEGSSTRYRTWNGSAWSAELTTPAIGGTSNSMELYASPLSDQIILMVNDDNSDINTITWSGTSWGSVTELETASGETKNQPFVFIYDQNVQSVPDSLTFMQSPVMCSDLVIPSGANIGVTLYVDADPGSASVAALSIDGGTNFISMINPTYNAGAGTATWTGTNSGNTTVNSGSAIELSISSVSTAVEVRFDSQTYPSKIDLPVTTYIDINSLAVYDAPYPGGNLITEGLPNGIAYVRATVSDPFGYDDITGLDLNITPSIGVVSAVSVTTSGCTRTYEYTWNTPATGGIYSIEATAKEGFENTVTDVQSINFDVCTDCPPMAADDEAIALVGGSVVAIDVLANDFDPNNNLDVASLAIASAPSFGTAVVVAGQIQYTPNGSYTGNDQFTYQICDLTAGTPLCDIATVNLKASVVKQLYLSDPAQSLDRVDPVASGDNSTSTSNVLSVIPAGVVVDAISSDFGKPSVNTFSVSHNTGSGLNRLMLVGVSLKNRTVSTVTYGGTALTKVGEQIANDNAKVYIYSLVSPASGSANVVVTTSDKADKGIVVGVMTFTGVDQNTPLGTFASFQNKSTNPTLDVTSAVGDFVFDVVSIKSKALTLVGTGQIQRWNSDSGSDVTGGGSTELATSSLTTMSWTADSEDWAIGAVAIKPFIPATSVSFTQTPALCDDLTITSGETITVSNYISIESGTMPASPSITAVLKYGATNIITLTNPTYSGGILTWSGTLPSDVTVSAGAAIVLEITTAQAGVEFTINYDSQTSPSKIDLPVSTYIDITSYDAYDAPYPGGSIITSVEEGTGTLVYLRAEVTDPFGAYDITDLSIDNQGTPVTGTNVASTSCSKTYEYALSTPLITGIYTYVATAKEGLENTVTDSESLNLTVSFDSDGDGLLDSVDIDDDNDGIKDTDEGLTLDSDGDTIPNLLDLDSDNDGIPDIVEVGLGSISAGTATIPTASFIDTNNNGMHDSFEGSTPLDSDGDGIPNYKDLDSDNDAVFDVDEARTERTLLGSLIFENGDGDSTGDGAGDGFETEAFRKKDDDQDGTVEYFGDGILDIYDYGTGANEYGNLSQGLAPHYVNNEDNSDTPDYIDLDSNNDGTFDIATTHYAHLDGDNDGIIDDTNDSDGDGLMDTFDTDDTVFGSPRDLQGKFDLFFDGRNDYVEDTSVMDGWSEATLMTWIKIDPTTSGDQIIFGQNSFYIQLNSDKTISAKANGNTVSSSAALNTGQWTHVAASYSNTNSEFKLYINGTEISSTAVSGALPSDSSSLTLGRQPDTDSKYFSGYIDEARVFFKALALNELQKMVYQEIEENSGNTKGVVVPIDVTNLIDENSNIQLPWNSLKRYYRMDAYKDNVLDDLTTPGIDEGSGARIYNTKLIESQSAPLPFVTNKSGKLDVAVNDPVRGINGSDALNNESAIVKIAHNDVYVDEATKTVGLMIDTQDASSNPIEFSVKNDSELNIGWYLELDGKLDLEGESQLVQGDGSILDADSSGYMEKDQQGTANSYNYNYWSSSVSPIGATGARGTASTNGEYTIGSFLLDGAVADNGVYPKPIDFKWHYTAADYGNSDPITISTYWLWKYHGTNDNYSAWQKIWPNTPLLPGEGYTMKGASGPVPISSEQNYVFRGKPNNGNFTLPLTSGNDRLIGNPYPSAMDTEEFIKDNLSIIDGGTNTNGNIFNGALYFWDHFGAINSHHIGDYVGGYATRNIIGGTPAIANDARINATGGTGTKIPGRYIPVNQGFFVLTSLDEDLTGLTTVYGGDIVFKNSQRVFKPETTSSSVFMRNSGSDKKEDNNSTVSARANDATENEGETRPLVRLNFASPTGFHRQILVGMDKNASNSFDIGYDALLPDLAAEDMFWNINDTQYVIQGVDSFDSDQELPIGLIISEPGMARISLVTLENIDPYTKLFIKDKSDGETYEITNDAFEMELEPGEYYDRFVLVFQPRLRTLDEVTLEEGILIFMNDSNTLLQINRLVDTKIESIRLFNALGQSLNAWETNLESRNLSLQVNSLSTGMYIVQLETSDGDIIKKMLVE